MLRDKTLAVLGVGMMGGALARGLVASGAMSAAHIRLLDTHHAKAESLAAELGAGATASRTTSEAISGADIILVAVKPPMVAGILTEIAPHLTTAASLTRPLPLVLSIAAGVRLAKMESLLPVGTPIIRVMPNTPSLIGKGAAALSRGTHATAEHLQLAQAFFSAVGITVEVPEPLQDAVTGLSGSGPAYIYLIIEALADGGVKEGLPRETARLLAAQTVLGAAQMVLSSDQHPAQLKDNVTTPGGTTSAALHVLERAAIRNALIDAVHASAERSRELS
jgi:pyrroline-5-carboxylate reductase